MEFITRFSDKKNRELEVFRLYEDDLAAVKAFYERQIASLERKEFFYPYTDAELKTAVSREGGFFIGAFDKDKLVSVSALDFDTEYGEEIKRAVKGNKDLGRYKAYEYAGLFTDAAYRGAGIIGVLFNILRRYAAENLGRCYLFAAVQISNYASLKNAFKRGFRLFYINADGAGAENKFGTAGAADAADWTCEAYRLGYGLLFLPVNLTDADFDELPYDTRECGAARQVRLLSAGRVGTDAELRDGEVYITYCRRAGEGRL